MTIINIKYFQTIPTDVATASPFKTCKTYLSAEGKLPVASLENQFGVTTLEEIVDGQAVLICYDEHGLSYNTFTDKVVINLTGAPRGKPRR